MRIHTYFYLTDINGTCEMLIAMQFVTVAHVLRRVDDLR